MDFADLSPRRPYLFVGDSYVFGWGVERDARLTEQFSRRLRQCGLHDHVVNVAVPGHGTYQYADLIAAYGARMNARLIVVGFFVGNDFLDDFETSQRMATGYASRGVRLIARQLLRSSPVINLFKYSLRKIAMSGTWPAASNRWKRIRSCVE